MTTVDPFGQKGGSGGDTSGFTFDPLQGAQTTKYIGVPSGGADATIVKPLAHLPFGGGGVGGTISVPGYVNGDQVKLLPQNADDLRTLQLALVQAGYISQTQANQMVLGSPDQVTAGAFAKLLATANYSHMEWRSALSARLATVAASPPQEKASKIPPLTVTVDNPDDIKAIIQKSAQTLLGGNVDPAQADLFVQSIQRQQRDAQTAAYYQQYSPTPGDPTTGTYGPGGTTVAAPSGAGITAQAEAALKFTDPTQYQATQIGAGVTNALDKLRTTGYL